MRTATRFALTAAIAAAAAIFTAPAARAATLVYSCPISPSDPCNGATYATAADITNNGDGTFTYNFYYGIDTTGYNGNSTDYIQAVAFKDLVDSYTVSPTLVSAPDANGQSTTTNLSTIWKVTYAELDANNCTGGDAQSTCATATTTLNGGLGVPVADCGIGPSSPCVWEFTFTTTDGSASAPHIKYRYVDTTGTKVGSLGSFNIGINTCTGDECNLVPVPEPASLLIFATGLAGVARVSRRRLFNRG